MARRRRRPLLPVVAGTLAVGAAAAAMWWMWRATRPVAHSTAPVPSDAPAPAGGEEIDAAERRRLEDILRERVPAAGPRPRSER
jgi:uncharacterized membrane protein YebE (DUF533 family)